MGSNKKPKDTQGITQTPPPVVPQKRKEGDAQNGSEGKSKPHNQSRAHLTGDTAKESTAQALEGPTAQGEFKQKGPNQRQAQRRKNTNARIMKRKKKSNRKADASIGVPQATVSKARKEKGQHNDRRARRKYGTIKKCTHRAHGTRKCREKEAHKNKHAATQSNERSKKTKLQ
ncbi:hypothetical protein TRVL_01997 [Trypanosoma vivax]|nr:hypothetical protein TRVL_01997 [Trypanosoma vivax]